MYGRCDPGPRYTIHMYRDPQTGQFLKGRTGFDPQTGQGLSDRIQKVCPTCGKEFAVKPSLDRVKHCSQSCAKKGKPSPWKGKTPSKETRQKMREAKLGNGGPDHWNWKHGVKERRPGGRRQLWRQAVIARDDSTCQKCGLREGKRQMDPFHAHHIKPWIAYPELRYEVDNGQLLCVPCHRQVHRAMKAGE